MNKNFHYQHLSNRTEKLYHELKKRLFADSHPLTKRVVIVPSAAMKSWLTLQLAGDPEIGIAAGIEIGFVEPTINHLFQALSDKAHQVVDPYEPSEMELALALEDSICAIARTKNLSVNPESQPLLQYLGVFNIEENNLSKRILKRIRALACTLAKLFLEYGVYGGQMIAGWQKSQSGWQGLLWEQMEQVFGLWNYPARKLGSFCIDPLTSFHDVQVHLFGLSYLASLYHRFLQKIAAHLPVYYYLLSPCQKFWGDILSDKESIRLRNYWASQKVNSGSLEVLEEVLRDRNPLLANFGRLGREMTIQTESIDSLSVEAYALPSSIGHVPDYDELRTSDLIMEETSSPLTLLEAVQADLALLRSLESGNKILFDLYDQTIQVHAAPKKMREVQVIYDVLMSIIDAHSSDADPILPGDIFVMAPNISEYAPYVQSVFESSESQLDIQLMDLQVPSRHLLIQGFLHLLSVSTGRWEASSLLQLFDYPAFRSRHHLTVEDIIVIRKWVKGVGIYWGKDDQHRKQIFKRNYDSGYDSEESLIGTWEYGLGRLVEELAISPEIAHSDRLETSQGDLLGGVIHLIRSLQDDLKVLTDGTEMTLKDWSTYLACLFDAYFLPGCDEGDAEGQKILMGHIESFGSASAKLHDAVYSFETVRRHLEEQLERERATYRESSLHAVRFSALLPMRAVPAKVVVLMGMGDGAFPRIEEANSLNLLLEDSRADYYPSRVDFDRYIFLESILSARRYFILSYVCQEPGDAKFQAPSLLVKELMGYLDHAYAIGLEKPSDFCIYRHPLNSFHHSCFSKENACRSYSVSSYLAALSYYHIEKKPRKSFLSEFQPVSIEQDEVFQEKTIELMDLLAFSKNPLKVYLNKVLEIYLDRESDRTVKDEEDLFLSDLNAAIVTRQGLFRSKAAALDQAEKNGLLPQGPFKAAGSERLDREIDQCSENLKSFGIHPDDLFSIEFLDRYDGPVLSKEGWKLPAIHLEVPGMGKVKIIGCLESICEQGIAQLSEDDTKKVLELWPSCLVLRWLIEKHHLPIAPQILFIKGKKGRIRKIKSSETEASPESSLVSYVEYYLKGKAAPSPLMPEWVPSIYSGKLEEMNNIFKDESNEEYQPKFDQYLTWLERNSPNGGLGSTAGHWQVKAQSLFLDLFADGKIKKSADLVQEDGHDTV